MKDIVNQIWNMSPVLLFWELVIAILATLLIIWYLYRH